MAQFVLYHDYVIDDSNMGCGSIIVTDCDGKHVYTNVCDILSTCDLTLPRQLNSQCVADFLNTLHTQTPGYYLRISANNCLEAVPAPGFIGDHCTVKVDAGDVCGYLGTKIIGDGNIGVTTTGPSDNRKVRLSYTGPTALTSLTDVSPTLYTSCVGGDNSLIGKYVKVNTATNTLESECVFKPMAGIYLIEDIEQTFAKNIQKHFRIGGMTAFQADTGMVETSPVVTAGDLLGNVLSVIKIPKSGIYRVSVKGNVRVNAGVQAFRVYVFASGGKNGIVDCKFGSSHNPKQPLVFRYDQPITSETYAYFNIGGDNFGYFDVGNTLVLRLAIDTASGTNIVPNIRLFAGGLSGGTYSDNDGFFGPLSGLGLTVEFLRSNNFTTPF